SRYYWSPLLDDPLRRLTFAVELPVLVGLLVRRVEDRPFGEEVGHEGRGWGGTESDTRGPNAAASTRPICSATYLPKSVVPTDVTYDACARCDDKPVTTP